MIYWEKYLLRLYRYKESEYLEYDFKTKDELMDKLRAYAKSPDDDAIRFKEKIKEQLLHCPELLYALHNDKYENELFDENGNLNEDGEWDKYFMSNIRPYLYIPVSQDEVRNYLCYHIGFNEIPKSNSIEKYCNITFTVFCNGNDINDKETGIARHDLIASVIREYFNWSLIFNGRCHLISDKETTTDNNYVTRTLVFELTNLNSITKTTKGMAKVINKRM